MEELRKQIEIDITQKKEVNIPVQPITREIVSEVQEETKPYPAEEEISLSQIAADKKVSIEEKTVDSPINSLDSGLEKTTEAPISHFDARQDEEYLTEEIEKVSAENTEIAFKEIKQTQELQYEKTVQKPHQPLNPSLPQLRVIGQFHNCYILAEGEKGLYIIDQHAAQERYHYEIIRNQILSGNTDTQPLLLPITIESTISAVSQAEELNGLLEQIGIHLEVFGDHTFVCRQLPLWMKDVEEEAFLCDMIDIWEKDKEISLDKLRKHAIATMACHSSIRFNRSLTLEEMKRVVYDLGRCEQPFHCPHGRPTMICMEDKSLIKEFERG